MEQAAEIMLYALAAIGAWHLVGLEPIVPWLRRRRAQRTQAGVAYGGNYVRLPTVRLLADRVDDIALLKRCLEALGRDGHRFPANHNHIGPDRSCTSCDLGADLRAALKERA
jgi:hypothetical protein